MPPIFQTTLTGGDGSGWASNAVLLEKVSLAVRDARLGRGYGQHDRRELYVFVLHSQTF
jgi:hypothetical protein